MPWIWNLLEINCADKYGLTIVCIKYKLLYDPDGLHFAEWYTDMLVQAPQIQLRFLCLCLCCGKLGSTCQTSVLCLKAGLLEQWEQRYRRLSRLLVTADFRANSNGSVQPLGGYAIEQECWGYFDKKEEQCGQLWSLLSSEKGPCMIKGWSICSSRWINTNLPRKINSAFRLIWHELLL